MATKTKITYYEGIGRRKSAIVRVRITIVKNKKDAGFSVNGVPLGEYFVTEEQQKITEEALKKLKFSETLLISCIVKGGGLSAQAEAIRLGLSRALQLFKDDVRPELKKLGFLTRDARRKERKKPGLHGARRGQQWSKR